MATKTITIDLEAYARLKSVQRESESFSRTIKRVVRPPVDIDSYARKLRTMSMSKKAIHAVEEHIRLRSAPSSRKR